MANIKEKVKGFNNKIAEKWSKGKEKRAKIMKDVALVGFGILTIANTAYIIVNELGKHDESEVDIMDADFEEIGEDEPEENEMEPVAEI